VADDGFTAFFQSAYPRIVGQLRLLTGDRASAEDLAQEAFIRAAARWRQLARYDQPEAWVRTTAFRLAIDQLRRAKRQRRVLVLHHCLDLPVEAVAAQTGVSPGTVKSRLSRGRDRLAPLLGPDASPPVPELVPEPQEERHAQP
jgi:RNA polymerase sigma-70 factor, ECF subfamily